MLGDDKRCTEDGCRHQRGETREVLVRVDDVGYPPSAGEAGQDTRYSERRPQRLEPRLRPGTDTNPKRSHSLVVRLRDGEGDSETLVTPPSDDDHIVDT